MRRLLVTDATPEDCARLAPNMRADDVAEIKAASGKRPFDALMQGYLESADSYAIRFAGQTIAMFGVVRLDLGVGSPWLLGSDAILAHWFEFARRSREEFERIRAPYTHLINYVDDRNALHKRWLQWVGFEFAELEPRFGVGRLPFWRFEFSV